jgi:hypothetical protein
MKLNLVYVFFGGHVGSAELTAKMQGYFNPGNISAAGGQWCGVTPGPSMMATTTPVFLT